MRARHSPFLLNGIDISFAGGRTHTHTPCLTCISSIFVSFSTGAAAGGGCASVTIAQLIFIFVVTKLLSLAAMVMLMTSVSVRALFWGFRCFFLQQTNFLGDTRSDHLFSHRKVVCALMPCVPCSTARRTIHSNFRFCVEIILN